jgi:hypothetical protein
MPHSRPLFSYWPITVGFILIVLALLMSLVGLHKVPAVYHEAGNLGPGYYQLGNESFEMRHVNAYRNLSLSSTNASVQISWEGSPVYNLTLTTNVTLSPGYRPALKVISGNVSYSYTVKGVSYPYSFLALPSLLSMVVGSVMVFVGYIRLKEVQR